ncbi:MAG: efflux RND transporter permease subunit [Pseudomonadota bacterium]
MRADSFYTNPRLTLLFILFVITLGGVAFSSLARQEDPTMTERWAGVNTFLPGATAARMESLVSEPIETALREIPEIKQIESTSKSGLSVVGVELYDHIGADRVDAIWSEVRDKLSDVTATLPARATEPELTIRKPLASTLILAVGWNQDTPIQLNILSRVAESLRLKLANLPGTEIAESWGEAEEELLVALDPHRLNDAGLTPAQIAERIRVADTKLPSGRVRGPAADLLVEVDAELSGIERIARIPLAIGTDGTALRLSDLAEVQKHRLEPANSAAWHAGERVILVNAKMQPGQQIAQWMQRADKVLTAYRATLPREISVEVVYDQAVYTSQRMDSLATNLTFALVIVLLVLIWFMGLRSAITVGIALPLSAGMVLIGMQFMTIPLHQMSVTGLIISLGLLIDNAIVVVEDYKLKRARGADVPQAINAAIRHLLIPLGASTATTVFAFMPIALAPGGVGDFTGTIGVTVALSVVSSFVLAMTIVPAIAGFIERRWPPRGASTRWWTGGYRNAQLTAAYRRSIKQVLARPSLGIAIGCVLPLIGFALAPTLTQQFFPPVDRNQFQVQLALPAFTSMDQTQQVVARADAVLRSDPRVTDSFWSIGKSAPRVFYNIISLNERVPSFASAWVNTTSPEATQALLVDMQATLSTALPEAEVLAIPFEQGPPTNAPVELRIVGQNLDTLRSKGEELRRILAGLDNVTYTRATLSSAEPKLTFMPNENAAARAGMTTGELARRLNSALAGELAGTVQEGSAELAVRVRLADEFRNSSNDLATLPLLSSGGAGIPLDQLGEWQLVPTATAIDRRQGDRLNTIQAFLVPYTLPASVLQKVEQALVDANFALPPGYALQFGGEAEESSESMGNLVSVFMFFVLAMAAVVVLSLNSFREAGLIGLVAVLSFGLALFGVRLFGYPFGYMALIGSLGMMGLAINGAIIVLSALKASPMAREGDPDATADVVVNATRHIVSTTATTIGGFVPLIVDGGTFWPPLATAIAGGVAGSALIALYMVPAVFHTLHRHSDAREALSPSLLPAESDPSSPPTLKLSA